MSNTFKKPRLSEFDAKGISKGQLLEAAEEYQRQGFIPVPAKVKGYKWNQELGKFKKQMTFEKEFTSTTLDDCLERFKALTKVNAIALLCGPKSDTFAVDVDDIAKFDSWLEAEGKPIETAVQHRGLDDTTCFGQTSAFAAWKYTILVEPTKLWSPDKQHVFEYRWAVPRTQLRASLKPTPDWLYKAIESNKKAHKKSPSFSSSSSSSVAPSSKASSSEKWEPEGLTQASCDTIAKVCSETFPEFDQTDFFRIQWYRTCILARVRSSHCLLKESDHNDKPGHGYLVVARTKSSTGALAQSTPSVLVGR
ncbi:uncharacterized protein EV422DRAFT_571734 [Fimicolochytrium jonesii]|uniref:uncharacterized protein n=1 Tax=Fimicolochytrium jonesii TaxID=1396493 RepID=UPI0022FDD533|nr:uncharacterized protein EV422DRAFT_571734 [Fimicolochytrium jonesii]KAI8816359.1 hypothetical protein EV422DRAFT_571734 [Fimicolochytrium jonesii]